MQDFGGYEGLRELLPMMDSRKITLKFELEIRAGVITEAGMKVFLSSLNKTTDCLFNAQRCQFYYSYI